MRVQGPILAGSFLDGFRDVVIFGLIICERVILDNSVKNLISGNAQGICPAHRGKEADVKEEEQDDRREDRQQEVEKRDSRKIKHTT